MTGHFIRSSYCDSNNCVEVWPGPVTVRVRDSTGTVLAVDRAAWRSLVAAVKA